MRKMSPIVRCWQSAGSHQASLLRARLPNPGQIADRLAVSRRVSRSSGARSPLVTPVRIACAGRCHAGFAWRAAGGAREKNFTRRQSPGFRNSAPALPAPAAADMYPAYQRGAPGLTIFNRWLIGIKRAGALSDL